MGDASVDWFDLLRFVVLGSGSIVWIGMRRRMTGRGGQEVKWPDQSVKNS